MDNAIGLKELRQNLKKCEKLVKADRSFVVMKRSRPMFAIGPVEQDGWGMVIDFTKYRKYGISADEILVCLKKL